MTENKKICTRCGYLRLPHDDNLISESECPKCGIIYQKFEDGMLAFDLVFNQKRMRRGRKRNNKKFAYVMMLFVVFASIFFMGFISGRTYTKYELLNQKNSITDVQASNQN